MNEMKGPMIQGPLFEVTDSVWKTLSYLYSDQVADLLEFQ